MFKLGFCRKHQAGQLSIKLAKGKQNQKWLPISGSKKFQFPCLPQSNNVFRETIMKSLYSLHFFKHILSVALTVWDTDNINMKKTRSWPTANSNSINSYRSSNTKQVIIQPRKCCACGFTDWFRGAKSTYHVPRAVLGGTGTETNNDRNSTSQRAHRLVGKRAGDYDSISPQAVTRGRSISVWLEESRKTSRKDADWTKEWKGEQPRYEWGRTNSSTGLRTKECACHLCRTEKEQAAEKQKVEGVRERVNDVLEKDQEQIMKGPKRHNSF